MSKVRKWSDSAERAGHDAFYEMSCQVGEGVGVVENAECNFHPES